MTFSYFISMLVKVLSAVAEKLSRPVRSVLNSSTDVTPVMSTSVMII